MRSSASSPRRCGATSSRPSRARAASITTAVRVRPVPAPTRLPAATTPATSAEVSVVAIPVIRMCIIRMTVRSVNAAPHVVAFQPIEDSTRHRVTSVDVARHAGVSQSTVSLVFSGKGAGRVSEATQERVRRCARELGYRPNVAAQALRLGQSRGVPLLVPDVTNPFFSRVLRGAQRAAQAAGYTVALVDTANDRRWDAQSFQALRAGPVDGYLLFEAIRPDGLAPDDHVVLIETKAPRRSSVRFDSEAGAASAFRH